MSVPDPTAGERTCDECGKPASEVPSSDLLSTWWADYECCSMACTMRAVADDASPPAVAASTGTSEDAEALASLLRRHNDVPDGNNRYTSDLQDALFNVWAEADADLRRLIDAARIAREGR